MGTAAAVRIHLLGALRVIDGDAPVRFAAPPKTLPLLGFLAVHRATATPREQVAYVLWPDASEEEARANLRRHLHYLQGALPARRAAWVLSDRGTVQWNPDAPAVLDIAEFERLSRSPATREEAVALYCGDLLARLDEEWLLYERDRLRNLQLTNLGSLIGVSAEAGEPGPALDFARKLLALDPFREDVVRRVMELRVCLGDSTGALAEYQAFAQRLREELGVEPMAETRASFDAIAAARAPAVAAGGNAPGAKVLDPNRFPMIGRGAALEQLRSLWSRATQGRGGLVLIGGEAGIGKTRLLEEFAGYARAGDAFVSIGRTAFSEPAPYQAIVEALRDAPLAEVEVKPIWRAVLARLIPEMHCAGSELETAAPVDSQNEQSRLFEAIFQGVTALARRRPVLLVLEDLHWCLAGSTGLLEFLVRRIGSHRVLIAGSYREEEIVGAHPLRSLRRRAGADRAFSHLAIGRLGPGDVEALIRTISAPGEGLVEVAEHLYAQSEGNPLFLGEALRDAIESGTLELRAGRWQIRPFSPPRVPRGVRATILERLARLSPQARTVAEIGAVIGPGFDLDLLRSVSGWPESRLLDATDELIERHVLRDAGESRSDFAFSHHLIQTTVYENGDERNRIRRHRRVARELELLAGERAGDYASQIALHFDRAREPAAAVPFYLRAASRALAVAASESAIELASRGLDLSDDPVHRLDLLEVRLEGLRRKDDAKARKRDLTEMLSLARGHDPARACVALAQIVGFPSNRVSRTFEPEELGSLRAAFEAVRDPRLSGELQLVAMLQDRYAGKYSSMLTHAANAATLFAECGDRRGEIRAWMFASEAGLFLNDVAEAQRAIDRGWVLWSEAPEHDLLVNLLHLEVLIASRIGEFSRARDSAREFLAQCEAIGDRAGVAAAHFMVGHACTALLLAAEAGRSFATSLEIYDELGASSSYAWALYYLSEHAYLFEAPAQALPLARRAEEVAASTNEPAARALSAIVVASMELAFGDPFAARRTAERAVRLSKKLKRGYVTGGALCILGKAELESGNASAAFVHLERGVQLLRESGVAAFLQEDLGWLGLAYFANR